MTPFLRQSKGWQRVWFCRCVSVFLAKRLTISIIFWHLKCLSVYSLKNVRNNIELYFAENGCIYWFSSRKSCHTRCAFQCIGRNVWSLTKIVAYFTNALFEWHNSCYLCESLDAHLEVFDPAWDAALGRYQMRVWYLSPQSKFLPASTSIISAQSFAPLALQRWTCPCLLQ